MTERQTQAIAFSLMTGVALGLILYHSGVSLAVALPAVGIVTFLVCYFGGKEN